MTAFILFKFKEYVQLSRYDITVPNINMPMIQYNTKIYKGVTNSIDFIVRDNDRKPVKLQGLILKARIQPVEGDQPLLLEKEVTIIDDLGGKAQLILDPQDIQDWLLGYYRFTISCIDNNMVETYLFTDINKDTFGTFQLMDGVATSIDPAIELLSKDFTERPYGDYSIMWTTGALVGDSQRGTVNGLHSIAIYTTNFQGKFWIQASLSIEPPLDSEWFNIPLSGEVDYLTFDSTTIKDGKQYAKFLNFSLNAYWVRFAYYADVIANKGTFDKILYKN